MGAISFLKLQAGKLKRAIAGTDYVPENLGGTGRVTYTQGDVLYGSSSSALNVLGVGGSGTFLQSAGAGQNLVWGTPGTLSLINGNAGALTIGMALYAVSAGSVDKAKGDSSTTSSVIGLALNSPATGASTLIQVAGTVTLTTGQWDAVAGTTGGLVVGTHYYLSASTAGSITASAPDTTGQEMTHIGVALSTTILELQIAEPITA